jgi:hypothetical protein
MFHWPGFGANYNDNETHQEANTGSSIHVTHKFDIISSVDATPKTKFHPSCNRSADVGELETMNR